MTIFIKNLLLLVSKFLINFFGGINFVLKYCVFNLERFSHLYAPFSYCHPPTDSPQEFVHSVHSVICVKAYYTKLFFKYIDKQVRFTKKKKKKTVLF